MQKIVALFVLALISLPVDMDAHANTDDNTEHDLQVLSKAEVLLRENKVLKAYELLNQFPELIGDSGYDYLLGLAALRSGKPGEAIFSLERAVANSPQTGTYMLDLARAYFDARDYTQAKLAFNKVLLVDPPAPIRSVIHNYLKRIHKELHPNPFNLQAFIELAIGSESNANNGTDIDYLLINEEPFELAENAKRTSSPLIETKFNTSVELAASRRTTLFSSFSTSYNTYPEASLVNNLSGNATLGLRYKTKRWKSNNSVSAIRTDVDGKVNSYVGVGISDQEFTLSPLWGIALFAQAGKSHLPYYAVHSGEFFVGGTRLTFRKGLISASSSMSGAMNVPNDQESEYHSKSAINITSLRVGVARNAMLFINTHLKFADYRPGYLGNRDDAFGQISTGFMIKTSPRWTLKPEISITRTRSSVDLYEYEKLRVSVSIQSKVL